MGIEPMKEEWKGRKRMKRDKKKWKSSKRKRRIKREWKERIRRPMRKKEKNIQQQQMEEYGVYLKERYCRQHEKTKLSKDTQK